MSANHQPPRSIRLPPASRTAPGPPTAVITVASRLTRCASSWPDDGLELGGREQVEQPARHVQARALAREPDEPRVGLGLGLDDDLGLGHVGQDAEAIDDRVQLGRLRRRDRLGRRPVAALGDRAADADRGGEREGADELQRREGDDGGGAGQHDERRASPRRAPSGPGGRGRAGGGRAGDVAASCLREYSDAVGGREHAQLVGCMSCACSSSAAPSSSAATSTAEALRRGHEVTLFHRGPTAPTSSPRPSTSSATAPATSRRCAGAHGTPPIDTSGYEPADVGALERAGPRPPGLRLELQRLPRVAGRAGRRGQPVWTEGDDYGPLKAACERAAEAAMPGRVASVRAGLICGPHDNIFRLPWWVQRIAAGGDVVAPGRPRPHRPARRRPRPRRLDARPRRAARRGRLQRHRAAPARTTMREALEAAVRRPAAARGCTGCPTTSSSPTASSRGTSCRCGSRPTTAPGTWAVGTERAQAAGLRCRPVAETVADTWAWLRDGGAEAMGDWRAENRPAGSSAPSASASCSRV